MYIITVCVPLFRHLTTDLVIDIREFDAYNYYQQEDHNSDQADNEAVEGEGEGDEGQADSHTSLVFSSKEVTYSILMSLL